MAIAQAATLAFLFLPTSALSAQASVTLAASHDVKAAFIYNFTKFVTWPSSAFANDSEPLRICIIDDGTVSNALLSIAKIDSKERKIEVTKYRDISDVGKCHLIFIEHSTDISLTKKILKATQNKQILTIGDSESFIELGGTIKLFRSYNNLNFEINAATATQSGLVISSKVLSLSKKEVKLP